MLAILLSINIKTMNADYELLNIQSSLRGLEYKGKCELITNFKLLYQ